LPWGDLAFGGVHVREGRAYPIGPRYIDVGAPSGAGAVAARWVKKVFGRAKVGEAGGVLEVAGNGGSGLSGLQGGDLGRIVGLFRHWVCLTSVSLAQRFSSGFRSSSHLIPVLWERIN
jgi:hypothetical protein